MSSATCPNCGHNIGCSCAGGSSITKALDGTTVCTHCIASYEAKFKIAHLEGINTN